MKPASKPAYDRLADALQETIPDCNDDSRYVEDRLEDGEKKLLGMICSACPLLDLCMEYALTEKPRGGWWPGHNLTNITRKDAA